MLVDSGMLAIMLHNIRTDNDFCESSKGKANLGNHPRVQVSQISHYFMEKAK